jgi:hypothetical protein
MRNTIKLVLGSIVGGGVLYTLSTFAPTRGAYGQQPPPKCTWQTTYASVTGSEQWAPYSNSVTAGWEPYAFVPPNIHYRRCIVKP